MGVTPWRFDPSIRQKTADRLCHPVLDRPNAVETSIRDYLSLSADDAERSAKKIDLMEMLDLVGLAETVTQLPDGIDTQLKGTGWPLSITETLQLKLAASIISQPRVSSVSLLNSFLLGS